MSKEIKRVGTVNKKVSQFKDKNKSFKNDFMQGGGKMGMTDPLTKQVPRKGRKLTDDQIRTMYRGNAIVQNIIDIPAEDCTREWIRIVTENDTIRQQLEEKLSELNAQEAFKKMISYERLFGDGFISIGTTETAEIDLEEPLDPARLKSIDYLHAFNSTKMQTLEMVDDPFSDKFGEIQYFNLKGNGLGTLTERRVHNSRIIHYVTRKIEDDEWGQTLLEPLYDIITVFDTALWTVGQVLYDFTFKKLKTPDAETMTREELQEARMLMDYMFRTEALAIIGPDEELSKEGTPVSGISELLDFVWEVLAGSARMPKSHILGQQAGTITGAQFDSLNYYARIAGIQENWIRPQIEYLIELILQSDEFNVGENFEWEIKFNPLWKLDKQTDAEIRDKLSQIDTRYIQFGVLEPDEVREARFGAYGLAGELDFSEDELEEISKLINEKRQDSMVIEKYKRNKK